MRIYNEPNGSFAVDGTGTLGNYIDVPFVETTASMRLLEPMESPLHAQQHIDGYPIEISMPRRAELSFEIPFSALGLATGLRVQSPLGRLLKVAFGGERLGTSTTVASTSTTSVINFTSAAGFLPGDAAGFATGAGGRLEFREISSIATNAVTLKNALSAIPANSSPIYAAATYFLSRNLAGTGETSLQVIVEGLDNADRWLLLGGQISSPPKLTLANGSIPKIQFSWQFAEWLDRFSTVANLSASALALATYSNSVPIVIKDSQLWRQTAASGVQTATDILAPAYEFAPNIAYAAHMAPGATNNIVNWIRQRTAPVISGSFSYPYESSTQFSNRSTPGGYSLGMFLQMGSSPTASFGGGVLLSAPTVQITDVQRVDVDGLACQQLDWKGRPDIATVPSGASDCETSAMRIHLF
jgi:hypothetical protein